MQRTENAPHPFRWTREAYHRLGELSFFPQNRRVELIEGEIIQMSPIGPRHAGVVYFLNDFFGQLRGRAVLGPQGPLGLTESSEPEPDLMLLQYRADFYSKSHPTVNDVLLVIEVSHTSAEFDLTKKMEIYAAAGIPEYWVVDLNRDLLVMHRSPSGDRYTEVQEHKPDDAVAPQAFADIELTVREILLLDE